jgi:bacterioferritin
MIKENLVAERVAIASYTENITWLGDADVTTRRLLEDVLAVEEEHASYMITLLEQMS